MEKISRVRTITRRYFTKSANALDSLICAVKDNTSKINQVHAEYSTIKDVFEQLKKYDDQIKEIIMASEPFEDENFEKELNEGHEYLSRWNLLESTYKALCKCENLEQRSKIKLPTLEMKKFDGNIKNWLTFWGQFKKIDSDPAIEDCEKLQFLCQNMQPDSDVRRFVENFPIINKSYKICLEELKARYARKDLLIQFYIRELLELILNKKDYDSTSLYDNMSSHLRSLEVLNVTSGEYSPFLLPLVESALPDEILKIWQRNKPDIITDELASLLDFLRKEVEADQRVSLANDFSVRSHCSKPTVACLTVNTDTKKHKEVRCIWCGKDHASTQCFRISRMTIGERREYLKKKKACTVCLKIGHYSKICRSYIKCFVCGRKHSPVLCTGTGHKQADKPTMSIQNYATQTAIGTTTLLQTVAVNVRHGDKYVNVRALFDNGSQRSYIKKEVVNKLNLNPTHSEGITHSLFGGINDPVHVQSKQEKEEEVLKSFKETVPVSEAVPSQNCKKDDVHYLPHITVSKETSLTTKLRPVFDASAKDKNGRSLNDCLQVGELLRYLVDTVFNILLMCFMFFFLDRRVAVVKFVLFNSFGFYMPCVRETNYINVFIFDSLMFSYYLRNR
ncbi:PREDICTED: uncharacterized protein LOC106105945 [Papilio polytes]|uniref:uncharacterized protein LOC106105945 n=1 Tax=Papilio polytes TaxID=76194 RepID=UPI0006766DCA|nr:PREDICTED: uncharacterized protein LOC106105945 [Papilio polytes]